MTLSPLPYHNAIRDFLKEEDSHVWEWFASNKTRDEQADAVRFDLLKNTYRVEREADPELYDIADEAAQSLSLDIPITIYQSQNPERMNAALAYVPGEAHIILEGPLKSKLSATETRSLFGHELAHYSLWHAWSGEFLVADQILAALTHDQAADAPHFASARLFQLYTEIFCDRGALAVVGDPLVVVSTLVKLATGLDAVNADSYIRQADEIFQKGKGPGKTSGLTHPEAFIRARALKLWHDQDQNVESKIGDMIEGSFALDDLDLLGQRKVAGLTRRLVDALLTDAWMRTELTTGHARLFFPEYSPPTKRPDAEELANELKTDDQPLNDYYCYVLLDFVTADRELEELALAAGMQLSEKLGLKERFVEIARKELRLTKKQIDKIDQEKASMLENVAERTV